jgi:hypothetical protein
VVVKKRKHLSAKQIKYFGTKRQRAALKSKRKAAVHHAPVKRKAVSKKKKTTAVKKAATSSNLMGDIISGLAGAGLGFAAGYLTSKGSAELVAIWNALKSGDFGTVLALLTGKATSASLNTPLVQSPAYSGTASVGTHAVATGLGYAGVFPDEANSIPVVGPGIPASGSINGGVIIPVNNTQQANPTLNVFTPTADQLDKYNQALANGYGEYAAGIIAGITQ